MLNLFSKQEKATLFSEFHATIVPVTQYSFLIPYNPMNLNRKLYATVISNSSHHTVTTAHKTSTSPPSATQVLNLITVSTTRPNFTNAFRRPSGTALSLFAKC